MAAATTGGKAATVCAGPPTSNVSAMSPIAPAGCSMQPGRWSRSPQDMIARDKRCDEPGRDPPVGLWTSDCRRLLLQECPTHGRSRGKPASVMQSRAGGADRFGQRRNGAARGARTPDPVITNDVLYQLSYCGNRGASTKRPEMSAPDIGRRPDWQEPERHNRRSERPPMRSRSRRAPARTLAGQLSAAAGSRASRCFVPSESADAR